MTMTPTSLASRTLLLASAAVVMLALSGCPSTATDCAPGLEPCGSACIDPQTDRGNCGACGIACGALQICTEGTCGCREGTTECNGVCVVIESDSVHCGACGNVCAAGEVCADSACVPALECGEATCGVNETCVDPVTQACDCAEGFERCGEDCVDTMTDPENCGACGSACPDVQTCQDGICGYGLAAACGNSSLVGLSAGGNPGPAIPLGVEYVNALGAHQRNVLIGVSSSELLQRSPNLSEAGTPLSTGADPQAILSVPPYLYAVTASDNTLHVFEQSGGGATGGYTFTSIGATNFGAHTSPQDVVRIGDRLYVPLFGNLFEDPAPGQRIAVVDISTPSNPTVISSIDLSGMDLQPYPGANPFPLPSSIVERDGSLYVGLNNLNALDENRMAFPGGPGLLARIDLATRAVATVTLDPAHCENVYDLEKVGDLLVVSCAGRSTYDAAWNTVAVEKSAIVLLDASDAHVATYPFVCTATDCPIAKAGRLAVKGNQVFVGDEMGRLVILTVGPQGFTEVRGFGTEAPKAPLQLCSGGPYDAVVGLVSLP